MVIQKLCYVIVVDDEEHGSFGTFQSNTSFCYTQSALQSLLQLVGCKVHHALKISRRVFEILGSENFQPPVNSRAESISFAKANLSQDAGQKSSEDMKNSSNLLFKNVDSKLSADIVNIKAFDLYKHKTLVTVKRGRFLDAICSSLEECRYVGPSQRADIILACRLRERKDSVTILLCGTSGCGKSTLSSLLASRLGITTVVSTDSIRHMMRSFINEKDNPLLWASTYHAGEFLDPVAVAEAKARKKVAKLFTSEESTTTPEGRDDISDCGCSGPASIYRQNRKANFSDRTDATSNLCTEQVGSKVLAIEGYKAQSEMVIDSLDKLITDWEHRKESVIVEGVHLSLNFVMGLMKKHRSIMPFLIYIADEEKHMERFAIRAKYMNLDPSKNKYVKYIKNIRTIQNFLCKRADKHLVPKVNNTNVDKSVASIHSTIFSCLRRRQTGVPLYDMVTNTARVINEEYCKQYDANSVSSKRMFQMIKRQGSLRRYMAIVNSDGSVTKAWPFSGVDKVGLPTSSNSSTREVGYPIYGPLQVQEAKPINIQFGHFGIGSWPNDVEGTSYMNNITSSRADLDDEATQDSSFSSSPLLSEGHAKELAEDVASESEEDQFLDEDDDSSETTEVFGFELEGSVTESSARSDEENEEEQGGRLNDGSIKAEKPSKSCLRTLSMTRSRIPVHEGREYNRFLSVPLRRSQSSKIKNAFKKLPSDV